MLSTSPWISASVNYITSTWISIRVSIIPIRRWWNEVWATPIAVIAIIVPP